jgi:hypothetical protein
MAPSPSWTRSRPSRSATRRARSPSCRRRATPVLGAAVIGDAPAYRQALVDLPDRAAQMVAGMRRAGTARRSLSAPPRCGDDPQAPARRRRRMSSASSWSAEARRPHAAGRVSTAIKVDRWRAAPCSASRRPYPNRWLTLFHAGPHPVALIENRKIVPTDEAKPDVRHHFHATSVSSARVKLSASPEAIWHLTIPPAGL